MSSSSDLPGIPGARRRRRFLDILIANRRTIQVVSAVAIVVAVLMFKFSLWWLLGGGFALGLFSGKIFCRWICPLGLVMEMMTGGDPEASQAQLYQYHKLGCPIAWTEGLLNKISLFKIRRNESSCVDCGACDKACYIASLNPAFSLYKADKKRPQTAYACSKCMQCVASCPTKSLTLKV
jgi:polyferredoxin